MYYKIKSTPTELLPRQYAFFDLYEWVKATVNAEKTVYAGTVLDPFQQLFQIGRAHV